MKKTMEELIKPHANELIKLNGVQLIAIGRDDNDDPCYKIGVQKLTKNLKKKLPNEIEGFKVEIFVTGDLFPLNEEL